MANDQINKKSNFEETVEEPIDSTWQELVGISPDPPDQRNICESCR